ncbi:hypothetical protein FRB90_012627 [Tulasnella sp. 427]|nr:hypothetical protein FRB90_012627 [Tulasnella sp. 427]
MTPITNVTKPRVARKRTLQNKPTMRQPVRPLGKAGLSPAEVAKLKEEVLVSQESLAAIQMTKRVAMANVRATEGKIAELKGKLANIKDNVKPPIIVWLGSGLNHSGGPKSKYGGAGMTLPMDTEEKPDRNVD